jgi:hypothetical protein
VVVIRQTCATLLIVLAVLLGALWAPSVWIQQTVLDEDGFLAVTQPMGEDTVLQKQISDGAVDSLLDQDLIPSVVADTARPYLQDAAVALTGTAAYQEIWDDSMVSLHAGLLEEGSTPLEVDLTPAGDDLLSTVEEKLPIDVSIPRPDDLTVTIATVPDIPVLRVAADVVPWTVWSGPLALLLAAAAIAISPSRLGTLGGVGVGAILVAGVYAALAWGIEVLVPDSLDQVSIVGPMVQGFEATLSADLLPQAAILGGTGALAVVVAVLLRAVLRRS